ncbi:MAG: DUF58 domain-containing protein, partial [Planctomycetota bacterium]
TTAASVICGLFVNPQVFLLTGAMVLVLVLGSLWPRLCMRGIGCRIEFDKRRVREGESAPVQLTVANRWPWPVWGLSLVDGFTDVTEGDLAGPAVALARVSGWSQMSFRWDFRPDRRGVFPMRAPTIETGFPFGIARAKRDVECVGSLIVWPRTVSLGAMPDAADGRHGEERLANRRAGDFGDMLGTRMFREGDSLRRVHWAQTARRRELIVVERQATATTAVRVVLSIDPQSDAATIERSIRVAASICESLYRQHAYVECLIGGSLYVCSGGSADFRSLMDAFARLRIDGAQDDPPTACPRAPRSEGLFEIVVATDGRLETVPPSLTRRIVAVGSADRPAPAHVCPWLTLSGEADWSRQWRRACHAT